MEATRLCAEKWNAICMADCTAATVSTAIWMSVWPEYENDWVLVCNGQHLPVKYTHRFSCRFELHDFLKTTSPLRTPFLCICAYYTCFPDTAQPIFIRTAPSKSVTGNHLRPPAFETHERYRGSK